MPPDGIPSYRLPCMGTDYMIAAGHYLATAAGFRILREGGNAVDAGVAAGISINVTLPHQTSFAGVAPIILHKADTKETVTISGLGRWSKSANLEEYKKKYKGDIPQGIPRTVVPAGCDGWLTALEHYGTMTFEQVVGPALELAERGFPISVHLSQAIHSAKERVARYPSNAEVFLPGGSPPRPGEVLVQKDLARVWHNMIEVERSNASKGREGAIKAARDYFYKGDVAERMIEYSRQQDGLLSMEDFSDFAAKIEKPEMGTYKEYSVYTCGAWCQGPSLIQIFNILEGFDIQAMGHNSAQYLHAYLEATKLAFSDRHSYYGDPDIVEVPMAGLLSKDFAAERRQAIDPDRAWPEMPPAGDPWRYEGKDRAPARVAAMPRSGPIGVDTSYVCVVDRWGNAFSATPSDPAMTAPFVPGLGMAISDRGSQTWLDPEHPCALGPWKRPRLTPNPAMAFKDGHLFMPFGTPGGDMQVQAMVQMFLNVVEFGMDPQQAIEEPRARTESFPDSFWPHAYYPGHIDLEGRIDSGVGEKLVKLGHKLDWWPGWTQGAGGLCGIMVDREKGILLGGADPRRESYALGW